MMKTQLGLLLAVMSPLLLADDIAGQDKSAACSACHGSNGVSIADNIPNLAGQKSKYLSNQLKAFRDGTRKNALMGAIAAQLDDEDIEDLAGFYGNLPPASESVTGELTESLDPTKVTFPENYLSEYKQYTTVNRSDNKQVRYLYANKAALEGAKGKGSLPTGAKVIMVLYKAKLDADQNPIIGNDGYFVKDALAGYGVMEKGEGWGAEVPEILRNSDWNYAFFTADKTHKAGINQAACMACHKPLDAGDYMFSADALRSMAAQ